MKTHTFLLLVFLLNYVVTYSQKTDSIYLTDFETFISLLQETHPDPYSAFGGKVQFAKAVKNGKENVAKCTNKQDFKELLTDFIAKLEDGHTFIYQENKKHSDTSDKFFPLVFKIATDGLFVDFTSKEYAGYVGNQLLKINDFTIAELLNETKKITPTENYYGVLYSLQNRIANFKSIKRIIHNESDTISLTLKDGKGKIYVVNIAYEKNPDWLKPKSKIQFTKDNNLLFYQMMEKENVGYFAWNGVVSKEVIAKMPSSHPQFNRAINWIYSIMQQKKPIDNQKAIDNIPELYSSFSSFLKQMKENKTKYLIIDLRENSGGMTPLCLPLLYMLYGDDYLNFDSKAEYNTLLSPLLLKKWQMNSIKEYNKANSKQYKIGEYIFDDFFSSNKNQTIEEKRKDLSLISYKNGIGKEYTENLNGKPIYRPKVIVLTSPKTFSASYHFLYYLTEIGEATVVGVPSSQAGNAFMETTIFELPNTKIKGSISNSQQLMFPNDFKKGKIFMPDFAMSIDDYKKYKFDKNSEILFVLDLIKRNRITTSNTPYKQ